MTSKRPREAELKDIHNTPDTILLFTSPCIPNIPHPIYGIAHYAQSPVPESQDPPQVEEVAIEGQEIHDQPGEQDNSLAKVEPLSLLDIITTSNVEELRALLETGSVNMNEPLQSGSIYPLHLAAGMGLFEMVKAMIEQGSAQVDIKNSEEEVLYLLMLFPST